MTFNEELSQAVEVRTKYCTYNAILSSRLYLSILKNNLK